MRAILGNARFIAGFLRRQSFKHMRLKIKIKLKKLKKN